MTESYKPRKRPCASCPYRCDVPSAIWHEEEYSKLERYDLPIAEQPRSLFLCHQGSPSSSDHGADLCAGWVGHKDPADLLAVRLGIIRGDLESTVLDYRTTTKLFPTGTAAAQHGRQNIEAPGQDAKAAIEKITAVRSVSPLGPVRS